jgi:hypothetical protein
VETNVNRILLVTLLACCAATASAQSLTLSLDEMVYELGDVMEITIANPSTEDVEFTGTPPYCVYNNDEFGAQCTAVPEITTFAAGEVWIVEYDTDDDALVAGACRVKVTWREDGTTYHIYEDFTLTTSVSGQAVTWGTLKGRYR